MLEPTKQKIHSEGGISPVQVRTRVRWVAMILGSLVAIGCMFMPELHIVAPGIGVLPNLLGEQVNKILNI